jgi:L-lactate dehydrogenase complex protein LldF
VDYIRRLAADKKLGRVVKGKSMVSEEIHLNQALEADGLEVYETDLGEYIIQLLGQRPSHIIGPAIHKTKEEIGRLFASKLGIPYTDVPEEMTRAVRKELRARFLAADLGITGANFAVAETGTLVLLENEGNIRMSTTLPPVHVAVMGIEKLVADWTDLAPLLRILPLSAVGQRLPSYVSFLTGPGRVRDEGPREFHLVLVDSFRSTVLADPLFRQMLRCLRCGACLNYCPVYRHLGGHGYPWVYSGPMGVALTAAAFGPQAARDVAGASTLCQACGSVCPVMIDLPGLILEARKRAATDEPGIGRLVDGMARILAAPKGYDLFGRLAAAGSMAVLSADGRVKRGPQRLWDLGRDRRLPRPAFEPFHRSPLDEESE